jgi:hypothetical protein
MVDTEGAAMVSEKITRKSCLGVVQIKNKRYTWLPLCYKNRGSAQNVSPIVTVKLLRIQEIQASSSHGDGQSRDIPRFYQSSKQILGQQLNSDHHQSPDASFPADYTNHNIRCC